MSKFIQIAEDIYQNDNGIPLNRVAPAVYSMKWNDRLNKFYLSPQADFESENQVYGNLKSLASRVIMTYNNRKGKSTGVLLVGEKGSGKTMMSRIVARHFIHEEHLPVILIDEPFSGSSFNTFIAAMGPCMVLFDEFEKTYDPKDDEKQQAAQQILSFFDGTTPGQRLLIATANDEKKLDENMLNRPGRIFYRIPFKGLDDSFIVDFCKENLKNQSMFESVQRVVTKIRRFNFDSLKALIEEMNRYNEPADIAVKFLNIIPSNSNKDYYTIIVKNATGQIIPNDSGDWYGDPLVGENLYIPVSIKVSKRGKTRSDDDDDNSFYLNSHDMIDSKSRDGVFVFKKKNFTIELHRNDSFYSKFDF